MAQAEKVEVVKQTTFLSAKPAYIHTCTCNQMQSVATNQLVCKARGVGGTCRTALWQLSQPYTTLAMISESCCGKTICCDDQLKRSYFLARSGATFVWENMCASLVAHFLISSFMFSNQKVKATSTRAK